LTRPDDIAAVPTTGTIILPPAPRSLDALGRNHSLEAALAELVDNAIDAGAEHVLIRFVQAGGRLTQLVIVDDGAGMDASAIDIAMTVGGERRYRAPEIGRFGFGLKAASFSQADVMTVLSRTDTGEAVGRWMTRERVKEDFSCEIVDSDYAAASFDKEWELPPSASGTIVRWDGVRGFPAVSDETEVARFLQAAIGRIKAYLGLVYHRLLDRRAIHIHVDVEDLVEGLGQRIEVGPLDPFAYPRTGVPGWPRTFQVHADGGDLNLHCHIWPGRSTLEQFRLDGDVIARQGIYVYFNDRLIQRGGWNGLTQADKQLSLARVAVNVDGDVPGLVSMKPEKNGIEVGPRFATLVLATSAVSGEDIMFSDYLDAARGYLKDSNRRERRRAARVPPGSGFDPRVRKGIEREIPMKDEEPISVRWAPLGTEDFFCVDREESTLWLNRRYRSAIAGGRAGSLNDVPVVKTLLYLLMEEIFAGQNVGSRDKDNLNLWQELLTRAAQAELDG
jgi:anti-sigma regulatory factor (Ser/Thr protein kinase)